MAEQLFRSGMARLGAAVSIVTTDGPAGRHGMVASAVSSVTDSPPTLLVCVNRNTRSNAIIAANGVFCVNVLADEQSDHADRFCAPLTADEKFSDIDTRWERLSTAAPALLDALACFDCRVDQVLEVGTHSIFIGAVDAIHLGENRSPLLYFERRYHTAQVRSQG